MEEVPVLDLGYPRSSQLFIMDEALRTYGFFYVCNHKIDIQPQFVAAKQLFALDSQEKNKMLFDRNLDIGYVGTGRQNLDSTGETQVFDTKEQFMQSCNVLMRNPEYVLDNDHIFAGSTNYDVPSLPQYSDVTEQYASSVYRLNNKLNDLLFECLGYHDRNEVVDDLCSKPYISLKQFKYVPDPNNTIGAAPHTDWGSFTILATDSTPGLQIQLDNHWLPVPPRSDCLIINAGDQIAQLSANKYRSALHRVITSTATRPRYSTAVFTLFNLASVVKPPLCEGEEKKEGGDKEERTSLDYFLFKLHESYPGDMLGPC